MRTLILAVFFLVAACAVRGSESVSLSANAVVSVDRAALFVAGPDSTLRAYSTADGKPLWSAPPVSARPLAEIGGRVLALGLPPRLGVARFLVLDRSTGAVLSSVDTLLGAEIRADVAPQAGSSFATTTEVVGPETLRIHWSFTARPLRGALLEGEENAAVEASGAVDLSELLADQPQAVIRESVSVPAFVPLLDTPARIAGLSGPQFQARDAGSIMTSREVADPTFGVRYVWSVYSPASSDRLGTASSLLAYTDFVVNGSMLLTRALPHTTHLAAGDISLGERVVAFDLSAGQEVWHVAVLSSRYEGLLPP